MLVARIGTDQWMLYRALEKLSTLDTVTPDAIETYIDAHAVENVFNVFEAALKSDTARLQEMIRTLSLSDDPYRLFGLLSGQVFQLVALAMSDKPSAEVAKDMGVHPFAMGKMTSYAKKLGRSGAARIAAIFIEADHGMKTSSADPWLLVERALVKVAQL